MASSLTEQVGWNHRPHWRVAFCLQIWSCMPGARPWRASPFWKCPSGAQWSHPHAPLDIAHECWLGPRRILLQCTELTARDWETRSRWTWLTWNSSWRAINNNQSVEELCTNSTVHSVPWRPRINIQFSGNSAPKKKFLPKWENQKPLSWLRSSDFSFEEDWKEF